MAKKNLDKLLERIKDIPRFPYFANLQITRRCNFNCMHCGFDAGEERESEFSTSELVGIINQLYELNCEKIQITGGEPLLREDVFNIASYGASLGIKMHLLSNGYIINEKISEKHFVIKKFMEKFLNHNEETAMQEAHKLEHALSEESVKIIDKIMHGDKGKISIPSYVG